jgi:flagellar protein FlgJ
LERAYGKNGGAAEGPGGETLPPGAPELGTREAGYPGPENTAAPPPLSSSASAASSASAGGVVDKTSRLYEQCEALEALLIKNLVQSMRNTVQKTELTGAGFAGEIYEDMLYDEYAKDFAKNARFGFAELAYLELTGQRGKRIARYS